MTDGITSIGAGGGIYCKGGACVYEADQSTPLFANNTIACNNGAGFENPTLADVVRLNVSNEGTSFGRVDSVDAARIARKVAGLETNP